MSEWKKERILRGMWKDCYPIQQREELLADKVQPFLSAFTWQKG